MPFPAQAAYSIDAPGTAYTPVWASSGTQPAIGNGTITGSYVILGSLVWFRARLVAGSTTTYGTGNYTLSLPPGFLYIAGVSAIAVIENTGVQDFIGIAYRGSGADNLNAEVQTNSSGKQFWGATTPFTFGDTDIATMTGTYIF